MGEVSCVRARRRLGIAFSAREGYNRAYVCAYVRAYKPARGRACIVHRERVPVYPFARGRGAETVRVRGIRRGKAGNVGKLVRCGLTLPPPLILPLSPPELRVCMVCVRVYVGTVERPTFGRYCVVYFSRAPSSSLIFTALNVQCLLVFGVFCPSAPCVNTRKIKKVPA